MSTATDDQITASARLYRETARHWCLSRTIPGPNILTDIGDQRACTYAEADTQSAEMTDKFEALLRRRSESEALVGDWYLLLGFDVILALSA